MISPVQRVRTYSYDELGNLIQKDSPADEGTTRYKYDKYKRLRFLMNSAALPGERGISFTKYDQLGRVLATGTLTSTYGWSLLDADKDYSVNQNILTHFENYQADTANFVCVNMYDKYTKSGIFATMPDPFTWSQYDANKVRNLRGKLVLTAFRDKPGQGWNYRIYLYDHLGNVNHIYQKFGTNPWKLIAKATNILNNITLENVYKVEGGSLVYEHATWKNYDKQGRLLELRSDPSGSYSSSRQEAAYTYNKADQLSTLNYNQITNANKTTSYSYSTTSGWLNTIQNGSNNFYESLGYYNNGNIQTQTLTNSVLGGTKTLSYSYDAMNRLAGVMNGSSTVESFRYDADGNFTGKSYLSGGILRSDGYEYDYSRPNRLSILYSYIDEFSYGYDYRGNLTSDTYTGIANITYDQRNLPLSMTTSTNTTYKYRYDDGGNRIFKDAQGKKEYYFRDDLGHEVAVYDVTTDRLKMINLYGSDLIGRIDVSWNYSTRSDARKFYVKDHLGSIRQTLNESGVVMSAMDYYAFGGTLSSYVNGSAVDKYRFTSKERDLETGLDYFGARYYDSKVGRWMSVDPLADRYPGWSPYNYCMNNPIRVIDPDGNEPIDAHEKPKLSNEQKQRLAKSEAQFTAGLLKSGYNTGKNSFINDIAPSLLTASVFGQGAGLAATGFGMMFKSKELIGAGLAISSISTYVHGGTTLAVGALEGNETKMWQGGIEMGLNYVSGGIANQIKTFENISPVAKAYLEATVDMYNNGLNFGAALYLASQSQKQKQNKPKSEEEKNKE